MDTKLSKQGVYQGHFGESMKVYLCAQHEPIDFVDKREWESCRMRKHAQEKQPEIEKCVVCGKATVYTKDTLISERSGYVEGGGQLCQDCYKDVYLKGQGCHG